MRRVEGKLCEGKAKICEGKLGGGKMRRGKKDVDMPLIRLPALGSGDVAYFGGL